MRRLALTGSFAAAAAAAVTLGAGPAAATAPPIHIVGALSGTWSARPGLPDTGTTYTLTGTGRTNYGATRVTGQARGTGFIREGRCSASLTLAPTAGKGRVTIDVTSTRTVPGGDTCQGGYAFTWTVAKGSGTGQYAGRSGRGTGYLDVTRANTFTVRLNK
jgi:hypothetical protein